MNVMIDLETLGTHEYAPIFSLGAVVFDEKGIKREFYINFDVSEQMDSKKRFADASTIKWWMNQSDAAKTVFKEDYVPTEIALDKLTEFILRDSLEDEVKPWGNGSTFDITLLETLYKQYGRQEPWKFWNVRDLRTFKEYIYDGRDLEREGVHHNALDDSIYQAKIVIEGLKRQKESQNGENNESV